MPDDREFSTWSVRRQDDNGNRFVVATGLPRQEADHLAAELAERGHKQHYWVELDVELPRPSTKVPDDRSHSRIISQPMSPLPAIPSSFSQRRVTRPVLLISSLVVLAPLALLAAAMLVEGPPRERSGRGAVVDEVRTKLYQKIDFPAGASDIRFRSSLQTTVLDFQVAEADARAWLLAHGWKPVPVSEDQPAGFPLADGQVRATLVTDGFRFDSKQQCGLLGVFDRTAGRMSLSYFCR